MHNYSLEFILQIQNTPIEIIKESIIELGEGLEITDCLDGNGQGKNYKIQINTPEPTIIFDTCAQFGRIKSVKINEG